jgi:hypothetical protein
MLLKSMAWYKPWTWGKKKGPVKVRKLARIPNHIGRLRGNLLNGRPWIVELAKNFSTLVANLIIIENKTKANFMTAQEHSLSAMSLYELKVYKERCGRYLKEIDASQSLILKYRAELKKHQREKSIEVKKAFSDQDGEVNTILLKLQEIDHSVEDRINYLNSFERRRSDMNEQAVTQRFRRTG